MNFLRSHTVFGVLLPAIMLMLLVFSCSPGPDAAEQQLYLSEINRSMEGVETKIENCLAVRAQLEDEWKKESRKPFVMVEKLTEMRAQIDQTYATEEALKKQREDLAMKKRQLTSGKGNAGIP